VVAPHGTASMTNVTPDQDALRAFLSSPDSQKSNEPSIEAVTTPVAQAPK